MTVSASSTSSPCPVHVEQLFNTGWSKQSGDKRGLGSWAFWAYIPIGIIIFLIRLGILIQFFLLKLILPKSDFERKALGFMGGILGVTVTTEGEISEITKVFVSNHITAIDHFVIHSITNAFHYREVTNVPSFLQSLLGIRSALSEESDSIIFFPEGDTTNGANGLLSFGDLPQFAQDRMVQPIALSVTRPLLNVNCLEGGIRTELFFTFFSINTHYTLKFLPVSVWDRLETQRLIATALHVEPTKFGRSDKAEYFKKVTFRPMSMASMARLVQQQLQPLQVSPDSVISALEKTGTVEGAVKELRKAIAQPSFPKNSTQRMCTFQERKRQMVEAAREKYLLKHVQSQTVTPEPLSNDSTNQSN